MAPKLGFRPRLAWNDGVRDYFNNAYGEEKFARICESLTRPSIYSCIRVNPAQATVDEVIRELTEITKTSDGTYTAHPQLKNVVMFRGHGPCEVNYGDDAPLKIVMVSRKCAESVLRGAEVFVPGVLACSEHVDQGDTVAIFARLEVQDASGSWSNGITRGTTLHQNETLSYLGDTPNDLFIGKGRAMLSRAMIFKEQQGIAVQLTERVYKLPSFHGLLPGKIFLQNLPSVVTAFVLDPKPGEKVLDMCAAPGGKTTGIASLMEGKGSVVALDRSHKKVSAIISLANELGLSNIQAYKLDALKSVQASTSAADFKIPQKMNDLEKEVFGFMTTLAENVKPPEHASKYPEVAKNTSKDSEIPGKYTSKAQRKEARRLKTGGGKPKGEGCRAETIAGFSSRSFDRVLLDAPCSALGLRPRLFAAEETLESLRRHASYQRRMFDKAVQLVRPGGFIVYSTCTINPGENEALVRYALDKYKYLSLVPQEPVIGGPGLVGGADVFDGAGFREWLRKGEEDLVQRFDPSSSVDSIGFFIAKFKVAED